MNYSSKLIKGSLFISIGMIFANIFSYSTKLILVRNITPLEYGALQAVLAFAFMFLFLRDLGLNQTLTKFIAEFNSNKENEKIKTLIKSILKIQIIISILFSLILFFSIDYLSENYFKNENTKILLYLIVLYFPISIIFKYLQSFFRGFQKPFLYSIQEPIKNLLILIITIIFLILNFKEKSLIIGYLITPIILLIIFIKPHFKIFNFLKIKEKHKNKKYMYKKLIKFSLPLIGISFAGRFISYFDTLMLTSISTLELVGVYNIVLTTALLFIFIPTSMSSLFMPIIAELNQKIKNKNKINKYLNQIYKYNLIIIIPTSIIFITNSKIIIKLLFGEEYLIGNLSFIILLIGIIFHSITIINQQYFIGIGTPKENLKMILLGALVNIILNLILIPKINLLGAAIATMISYFIMFVYSTYNIKNKTFFNSNFIKLIFLNIILIISIYLIKLNFQNYNEIYLLIISTIAGSLFYSTFLILLKIISIDEIKLLIKK